MPVYSEDYALVIGINDYPNFGADGRPLFGAVRDANSFAEWLVDKHEGGGLPDDNCKVITSSSNPLKPIRNDIDEKLAEIWAESDKNGARRLYFYFSGHGQTQDINKEALCLANLSQKYSHAALNLQEYKNFILRCMGFKEIVFFLDCCRIRAIKVIGLASEIDCKKPVDNAGEKRTFIAYATEFQNAAYEAEVADGQGVDENGPVVRGHFTQALIAALRGGADTRPEGGVTPSSLQEYLEREVPRLAAAKKHNQKPQIDSSFSLVTEPVFGSAKPKGKMNIEIVFKANRSGEIELVGPDGEIIKTGDASSGHWKLLLSKGLYLLREISSEEEKAIRFDPAKGVTHEEF